MAPISLPCAGPSLPVKKLRGGLQFAQLTFWPSSVSCRVALGLPLRIEAREPARRLSTKTRHRDTPKKVIDDTKQPTLSSQSTSKKPPRGDIQLPAVPSVEEVGEDDMLSEDALEALFAQLEKDLEEGGPSDDEDLTEDEMIELENELTAALMEYDDSQEELTTDLGKVDNELGSGVDNLHKGNMDSLGLVGKSPQQSSFGKKKSEGPEMTTRGGDDLDVVLEEDENEESEQRIVTLEPWQLKKLAAAAQVGRRHTNIKALAAEVGLDRFDVLAWLKDPPAELLMYSATMETEEDAGVLQEAESNLLPKNSNQRQNEQIDESLDGRRNWHSQKRLRKVHQATFERVFSSTDRPSNSMVQNLVEITHVPRKRIVEWFEERRKEVKPRPKFDTLR